MEVLVRNVRDQRHPTTLPQDMQQKVAALQAWLDLATSILADHLMRIICRCTFEWQQSMLRLSQPLETTRASLGCPVDVWQSVWLQNYGEALNRTLLWMTGYTQQMSHGTCARLCAHQEATFSWADFMKQHISREQLQTAPIDHHMRVWLGAIVRDMSPASVLADIAWFRVRDTLMQLLDAGPADAPLVSIVWQIERVLESSAWMPPVWSLTTSLLSSLLKSISAVKGTPGPATGSSVAHLACPVWLLNAQSATPYDADRLSTSLREQHEAWMRNCWQLAMQVARDQLRDQCIWLQLLPDQPSKFSPTLPAQEWIPILLRRYQHLAWPIQHLIMTIWFTTPVASNRPPIDASHDIWQYRIQWCGRLLRLRQTTMERRYGSTIVSGQLSPGLPARLVPVRNQQHQSNTHARHEVDAPTPMLDESNGLQERDGTKRLSDAFASSRDTLRLVPAGHASTTITAPASSSSGQLLNSNDGNNNKNNTGSINNSCAPSVTATSWMQSILASASKPAVIAPVAIHTKRLQSMDKQRPDDFPAPGSLSSKSKPHTHSDQTSTSTSTPAPAAAPQPPPAPQTLAQMFDAAAFRTSLMDAIAPWLRQQPWAERAVSNYRFTPEQVAQQHILDYCLQNRVLLGQSLHHHTDLLNRAWGTGKKVKDKEDEKRAKQKEREAAKAAKAAASARAKAAEKAKKKSSRGK